MSSHEQPGCNDGALNFELKLTEDSFEVVKTAGHDLLSPMRSVRFKGTDLALDVDCERRGSEAVCVDVTPGT